MNGMSDKKTIAELYAHIGNSGYTFKVVDNGNGSEFSVEYDSLGITSQKMNVLMDVNSMREVGKMLIEASKAKFTNNGNLGTASLVKYDGREKGDSEGCVEKEL